MSVTTGLPIWLSVLAFTVLSTGSATRQDETGEPESSATVDGDCEPAFWEKVSQFYDHGDAESAAWAIGVLQDYLQDSESQCKAGVKKLLKGIGEHKPQGGADVLVKFLRQDPALPWAVTFAVAAADSLVAFGPSATEYLVQATSSPSERVVASAALGLGRLGGADTTLTELLGHPSAKVRRNALVALSNTCSTAATNAAVSALSSLLSDVRGGAMFYLSTCGSDGEIPLMVGGLADDSEEIRVESLRGLIRLSSAAGCGVVRRLMEDESQVVKEVASKYREQLCCQSDQ